MTITILLICFGITSVVYADIWSGGKYWDGVAIVQYDNSVSTYGYATNYDSAMGNWKNISSKVDLIKASHDAADIYYVGETASSTTIGRIIPYDSYGRVADLNSKWYRVTVHMYDNTMKSFNMTSAQITSNATHEIGHSLKLAHPSGTIGSVMNQGIQSIGPTVYDKNELKRKWGE